MLCFGWSNWRQDWDIQSADYRRLQEEVRHEAFSFCRELPGSGGRAAAFAHSPKPNEEPPLAWAHHPICVIDALLGCKSGVVGKLGSIKCCFVA